MDFSYKNYVKRFSYRQYQWPPDTALAELHSRCSEPGPVNPNGVTCPCCGFQSKQRLDGWLMRDIYSDFKEWGAGIPAYFGLLRFYNVVAFVILLINAIYPMYAIYYTCAVYKKLDPATDKCVEIGAVRYLAFSQMLEELNHQGEVHMVRVLEILQACVFYVLLVANNLSIFYLVYINKRCKSKNRSRQRELSLLVENLPWGTTENSLRKIIAQQSHIHSSSIKEIIFVKEIKHFAEVFKERIKAYFALKALYVDDIDPKKQQVLNERLINLNGEYHRMRQVGKLKNQKAIVIFESREDANKAHEAMQLHEGFQWWYGFKALFSDYVGVPIFSSKMPELQETRWANLGENHTAKMLAKIQTFLICIILIGICYALFYFPLKISLNIHAGAAIQTSAKMTLGQKFLPVFISLAMLAMSIGFRHYMQVLAEKRSPKTYLEQAQFVLVTTVLFHLVFYQLIPTLFFLLPNGINKSIKLYTISEQARTFIFVQLILSLIDFVYRMWRRRKTQALADQRQAFKYPQRYLHEKVQYREYPLELKLIIMFKIWSLSLFYSLELPYITILISFSMFVLYLTEKRNLYHHYTQRRFLGVDLQINFLNIYINFFCIYECVIYCLNANSATYIFTAIAATFLSLLCQFVYWRIIKDRYNKAKAKKLASMDQGKPAVEDSNSNQSYLMKEQDGEIIDQTYADAYREFLIQFNQKVLDQEIDGYIDQLLFPNDTEEAKSIRASSRRNSVIQMTQGINGINTTIKVE